MIIERLSPESLAKVEKAHPEFDSVIRDKLDAVELWKLVEKVHAVGDSAVMIFNVILALKTYVGISQNPKESLVDFKRRFDDNLKRLEVLGEKKLQMSDEMQAALFILSLDTARYGTFVVELENNVNKGIETVPATLPDAFEAASTHKKVLLPPIDATSTNKGAVFNTNGSEAKGKGKRGKTAGNKKSDGGKRSSEADADSSGETRKVKCFTCDQPGHVMSECPHKELKQELLKAIQKKATVNVTRGLTVDNEAPTTTKGVVFACPAARVLSDPTDYVLFDNQASHSIISNPILVHNIRRALVPCDFSGWSGGELIAAQEADMPGFGVVYYAPGGRFNILSQRALWLQGVRAQYYPDDDTYVVKCKRGIDHFFTPGDTITDDPLVERLYPCHVDEFDHPSEATATVNVTTVAENKRRHTDRQLKDADRALNVIHRMGYPSIESVMKAITSGVNFPVTRQHIELAYKIYGKNLNIIKGKSKSKKPSKIRVERLPETLIIVLVLSADIMFVKAHAFLLSVTHPIGVTMVKYLGPINKRDVRTANRLREPLKEQVAAYKARGFTVDTMLTDPEGPFLKLEQEINDMGIVLNPAGAGSHVPVIERKIQEVKEHCRCVAAWAPFNVRCKTFIEAVVYYVVSRINLVPHKGGVYSSESPRELSAAHWAQAELPDRRASRFRRVLPDTKD